MATEIDLGKQIGPLPLGAWLAVVGTGLGIALYTRNSDSGSEAPVIVEDTSGIPGVGTGEVGGWTPTSPVVQTPSPETPIATNEEWGVAVINFLIAFGTDAVVADSAIRKYLAGSAMNLQESALLRLALVKLGSPPVPLPPGPVNPKPPIHRDPELPKKPPTPPKPKPKYTYRTVKPWPSKESTLSGIAAATKKNWRDIYNLNRAGKVRPDGKTGMITNPNSLKPGWVLLIP